ncbi:unnamed protein product, partial [Amoebophrya sp. A120]
SDSACACAVVCLFCFRRKIHHHSGPLVLIFLLSVVTVNRVLMSPLVRSSRSLFDTRMLKSFRKSKIKSLPLFSSQKVTASLASSPNHAPALLEQTRRVNCHCSAVLFSTHSPTSTSMQMQDSLKTRTVEVERKFVLTETAYANIQERCKSKVIEGTEDGKNTITHRDTYYDLVSRIEFDGKRRFYAFTSQDWWLRQRDGSWELKKPVTEEQATGDTTNAKSDAYEEIQDETRITELLCAKALELEAQNFVTGSESDYWVWKKFVDMRTFREKWIHDGTTLSIDIDRVEYLEVKDVEQESVNLRSLALPAAAAAATRDGAVLPDAFRIFEVECLLQLRDGEDGEAEIAAARERIAEFGEELMRTTADSGECEKGKEDANFQLMLQGGKILYYLQKYSPDHFKTLVAAYQKRMQQKSSALRHQRSCGA